MSENALAGFDLPDPIAMAAAIDRGICQFAKRRVDVTTGEELARGHDSGGLAGRSPRGARRRSMSPTSADRAAFVELLKRSLS